MSGVNVEQPRLAKTQRQHRIAKLLAEHAVTSQTQLGELLSTEGVAVGQATLSRDLDEMGAIKVRVPGGETIYAVPELSRDRFAPEEHVRRVLADWVVEVGQSGNLVVLQTPPGCAHVVASALDRSVVAGLVGTVAGDDTVLLVAAEDYGGIRLAEQMRSLVGL